MTHKVGDVFKAASMAALDELTVVAVLDHKTYAMSVKNDVDRVDFVIRDDEILSSFYEKVHPFFVVGKKYSHGANSDVYEVTQKLYGGPEFFFTEGSFLSLVHGRNGKKFWSVLTRSDFNNMSEVADISKMKIGRF